LPSTLFAFPSVLASAAEPLRDPISCVILRTVDI
jgi:hypothetical protein